MEINNSCCCCLLRPPDQYLKMPYTRLGKTEIYMNMLKECFEIHLMLQSNDSDGICKVCVARLQDASDFKLQVQRSQAELRARLEGALHIKEEASVKTEVSDDHVGQDCPEELIHEYCVPLWSSEEHREKTELSDDDIDPDCREQLIHAEEVKTEISNDPLPSDEGEFKELMADTCDGNVASEIYEKASSDCARKEHYEKSAEGPNLAKQKSGNICDTLDKDTRRDTEGQEQLSEFKVKKNIYTCDICEKQFARKNGLIRHKRVHVIHVCDICYKTFKQKSRLDWHRRVHTGEKPYGCEICKNRYPRKSSLIEHKRRVHTGRVFICDLGEKNHCCHVCGKQFARHDNLRTHLKTHVEGKNFPCELCSKSYSTKESLRQHKRTHTKEKAVAKSVKKHKQKKTEHAEEVKTEVPNDPLSSDEGELKELMTDTCDGNVASEIYEKASPDCARKEHYEQSAEGPDRAKQKSGNICDSLKKDTRRDTEGQEQNSGLAVKKNTYTCDICEKQFAGKNGLINHIRVHVKHICDVCNKQFKKKSRLDWHKRVHTGEKPYGCDICKKRYPRKYSLIEHKLMVHTGRVFICDVCKKQYPRKESLTKHLRVHMRQKLYPCQYCYTKFLGPKNLKTHIETYHTNRCGCDVCKKVFTCKSSLSQHLKTHTKLRFSCDVCSVSLASKNGLLRHKLLHTGEKSYGCEICKKRFPYKEALKKHETLHTGEKNHCCYVCGKLFARQDNLRTHLKTHVEGKNFPCELCSKSYSTREGLRQHKRTHTKEKAVAKSVKKHKQKKTERK